MFCIHCKYTSFDYLPSCPRCGRDWTQTKTALNLQWVIASVHERRHQRQVPENDPEHTSPSSFPGSQPIQKDSPELTPDSPPSSPQVQSSSPRRPEMQKSDEGEDELDFPDLDTLLHPQAGPLMQEKPQTDAQNQSEMPSPDQAQPHKSSGENAAHEDEESNEEFLDLSSLVYDLGLEVDESQTSQDKTQSPSSGHGGNSPTSKQG